MELQKKLEQIRRSYMWYVIQVRTGSEDNIRLQCEKNISPNILKDCFIPYYEERRHLKGEWRTLKKILFPGYVFLDSEEFRASFYEPGAGFRTYEASRNRR